ncbi:unnamed protein product [Rangifer tarandus platyrhynchus]|uniref:Uncharacterized protein n=2 Tax=Rangifer tarandus platyrhynchus TaxID=3082113 RepID=A0ABN8ZRA1_RANTA|nr:unnamed protein product [Rangifer tarandus platyrhynchus]CAI9706767.1 unnamed protein product [Rangifer tarandus platyrhynchus]
MAPSPREGRGYHQCLRLRPVRPGLAPRADLGRRLAPRLRKPPRPARAPGAAFRAKGNFYARFSPVPRAARSSSWTSDLCLLVKRPHFCFCGKRCL